MYNGKQETSVMRETFHRKSYDQINSQSEKKQKYYYIVIGRINDLRTEILM